MNDTEPEWHVKTRGYHVRPKSAGGYNGKWILQVMYKKRSGAKAEPISSNHPKYS